MTPPRGAGTICIVALSLLLNACSIPGFGFSDRPVTGADAAGDTRWSGIDEESNSSQYSVLPITSALLRQEAADHEARDVGKADPDLHRAIANYEYRAGPQDVLRIVVWGHPELTLGTAAVAQPLQGATSSADANQEIGLTVQADGNIYFPYAGNVRVAGLTAAEIRVELARALAPVVRNPQIGITVIGFHSQTYQLSGAVVKPGLYPVTNVPFTVSQAVQAAGGILQSVPTGGVADKASAQPLADLGRVIYIDGGKRQLLDLRAFFLRGDETQDRLIRPGDIIQVPDNSSDQVHLIGEVQQPGNYPLDNGHLDLAQALGSAGGLNLNTADASRIFVFRGAYNKPEVFWLDAGSPDAMLLATQFDLHPQDVVYVAAADVSTWNRVISQILPTVQALYEAKVLVNP